MALRPSRDDAPPDRMPGARARMVGASEMWQRPAAAHRGAASTSGRAGRRVRSSAAQDVASAVAPGLIPRAVSAAWSRAAGGASGPAIFWA